MVDMEGLRAAVIRAAGHWDEMLAEGDANIVDVYLHARKIEGSLGERPPSILPARQEGLCIVEAVEARFMAGSIIRSVAPEALGDRARVLVEFLQAHNLIPSPGFADMYVAALYAWHGCLNMAKLLRKTYVVPTGEEMPYRLQQRLDGHRFILSCALPEEPRGQWVRLGMSLARPFEKGRGKADRDIHDEWVPQDSPYWQG